MAREAWLPPLCNYATLLVAPVVVQELFAARLDQPVVGVATGWLAMRRVRDEGAALLEAGQHARARSSHGLSGAGLRHQISQAITTRSSGSLSLRSAAGCLAFEILGDPLEHQTYLDAVD